MPKVRQPWKIGSFFTKLEAIVKDIVQKQNWVRCWKQHMMIWSCQECKLSDGLKDSGIEENTQVM